MGELRTVGATACQKITFLVYGMCRGDHWSPANLAQHRVFRGCFLTRQAGTGEQCSPLQNFFVSCPKKGFFYKLGTHSCVPWGLPVRLRYRDGCGGRHICRPYGLTAKLSLRQNRGRGLPRPCRAMNFYCPVGRGDPTPPRDWAAAANFRLVSRFYTRTQKAPETQSVSGATRYSTILRYGYIG